MKSKSCNFFIVLTLLGERDFKLEERSWKKKLGGTRRRTGELEWKQNNKETDSVKADVRKFVRPQKFWLAASLNPEKALGLDPKGFSCKSKVKWYFSCLVLGSLLLYGSFQLFLYLILSYNYNICPFPFLIPSTLPSIKFMLLLFTNCYSKHMYIDTYS